MTIAENVVNEFRSSPKTTSIPVLAARAGCQTDEDAGMLFYLFNDGSRIGTRGRGPNHDVWTYNEIPDIAPTGDVDGAE